LRVFDCDLRRYATDYGADAKSFLGEAKQHQLDRTHPLIELDPNKCILCGRCVRICSELVGIAAYGYIQRGFNTVVKPSLGGSLLDTACVACGLCVETCPTAAIAEKSALAKPGPWVTKSTPTVCTYCGVGCRLSYQTYGNLLVKVSHGDPNGPVAGNHCRKGRFGYRYAQAADRLVRPRIRAKDELTETSIGKAIAFTAKQLKELRRHVKPSQVAVFVSPRMTNEEIFLAKKLARGALGTTQVTSLSSLVNLELACPEVQSTATYQDVEDAQAILAVNADLEQEHFVAGLACKKAMRKGARLIYIGPREDGISRFADVYVRCEEGEQAAVMAELSQPAIGRPELAQAARILEESPGKVMIFDKDHPGLRRPGDERVFAQAAKALGCKILAMREKSNMQGLSDILGGPSARVAAALKRKGIKVALILGEDPLGDEAFPGELREGLLAAEFLVVGDLFLTATAERAHAVFPLSSTAETSGTVTNQEGRVQSIVRAVSPVSGAETWQVLCQLGSAVGAKAKLRYKRPAEITDEIRRALPSYRSVKIDAVDATGIRRLRRPGALKSETLMSNDTALVKRVPTLGLDTVEVRFTCWHDQLFRKQATIAHLPEMPASSLPISA
jgi:formate dehydrogenase major subunit